MCRVVFDGRAAASSVDHLGGCTEILSRLCRKLCFAAGIAEIIGRAVVFVAGGSGLGSYRHLADGVDVRFCRGFRSLASKLYEIRCFLCFAFHRLSPLFSITAFN